jgi:isoleucyl-tRNA synthetase
LNVRDLLFTESGTQFPDGYEVAEEDDVQHGGASPRREKHAIGINTRLTRELENEGLARELIHKIQNLRKEAGFKVTDRIVLSYRTADRLVEAVDEHRDYIGRETLTMNLDPEPLADPDIRKAVKVNGIEIELAIRKTEGK